jgi:hypothetical protein
VEHVASAGKKRGRGVDRVMVGKPEGKRPLEILRVLWNIILKRIFNRFGGRGFE